MASKLMGSFSIREKGVAMEVKSKEFSTLEGSRVGAEFVENYLVQENAFICFKSALSFLFCSLLFLSAFSPPPQKEVEATFREATHPPSSIISFHLRHEQQTSIMYFTLISHPPNPRRSRYRRPGLRQIRFLPPRSCNFSCHQ